MLKLTARSELLLKSNRRLPFSSVLSPLKKLSMVVLKSIMNSEKGQPKIISIFTIVKSKYLINTVSAIFQIVYFPIFYILSLNTFQSIYKISGDVFSFLSKIFINSNYLFLPTKLKFWQIHFFLISSRNMLMRIFWSIRNTTSFQTYQFLSKQKYLVLSFIKNHFHSDVTKPFPTANLEFLENQIYNIFKVQANKQSVMTSQIYKWLLNHLLHKSLCS